MELNLYFLAPLLQCTSIDICALFMRAKKNILFYSAPEIKYIISFSLSLRTSLSLSQSLSSHPLPRISQSLKLSSSLNHSPLSPSLSQSPSFTAASPTQSSQATNRLTVTLLSHCHSLKLPHSPPSARPNRPKLPITSDPRCRSPQTHAIDPPLLPT